MAERPSIIPSVAVQLDRPRHLRFDRQAVFDAERELYRTWGREMTFFEAVRGLALVLVEGDMSRLSLNNIAVLMFCGCKHEDPGLTLPQVQAALPYNDPPALLPLVAQILEAWQAQSPPAPETPQEARETSDPLAASTGSPSGALSAPALA